MNKTVPFGQVLDIVETWSKEEQETFLDILSHRMSEMNRQNLISEIEKARKEFAGNHCQPASVDEIMKDIQS